MAIQVTFATLVEDRPGASWQALFERLWPAYRAWFLRSGTIDRTMCSRDLPHAVEQGTDVQVLG